MGLHPVILAGGSGTRLWPLSRELYPKQFLSLTGDHSLLQETILRLGGIEGASPAIIVCNEEHRFLVAEHTRQLGRLPSSIVLEPAGRNTAPALTLAALGLADQHAGSDDPVMLVLPADHMIRDVTAFQSAVARGLGLAGDGCLVTFGVVPTSPATGYGYIKKGRAMSPLEGAAETGPPHVEAFLLDAFVEKPTEAVAARMLRSQDYLWNSGMFMMTASVWLEQLNRFRPDIVEACRAAHVRGQRDGDFYRPDAAPFMGCPSDAIDYAVMEKVAGKPGPDRPDRSSSAEPGGASVPRPRCAVIPLDAGWSDVGAWSAFWEEGAQDLSGNVVQGDVLTHSVHNSLLIGQHRLLAAVGLDDIIVVETPDAVLVSHKDKVQDVRAVVARLKEENRPEQENHRKVHRPWGSYETLDKGSRFLVKRVTVNPGAALSLQMHHHRAEHWVVVKGTAQITKGDDRFLLTENQSTDVPLGARHRLENPGTIPLEVIEVQSGSYLGEDDIRRFEDRYNRHITQADQGVVPTDGRAVQ